MTSATEAIARLRAAYQLAVYDYPDICKDDEIVRALPALLACAEALQHLLRHSGIADVDARDKDKQDHDIERKARAALQALAEGGGE